MRRMAIAVASLLALTACGVQAGAMPFGGFGPSRKTNPAVVALRDYSATIRTNLGEMTLELVPDAAPNAVRTFLKLAGRGAYDGLHFTALFKGKMLVAGAPPSAGKETIEYETSPMPAEAGAVAMDRAADGSNSPTTLLALLAEQEHLERDYTVFARIDTGLDVAKRIGAVPTRDQDGCPAPAEDVIIETIVVTKHKAQGAEEPEE